MTYVSIAAMTLFILYLQPSVLEAATRSNWGKAIIIGAAVLAAAIRPLLGAMVVVAYIAGSQSGPEGFSAEPGKPSGVQSFRSNNCVSLAGGERALVGVNGTVVRPASISSEFPSVRFADGVCDPCKSDCKFDLLSIEEGFRAPSIGVSQPKMLGSKSEDKKANKHPRPSFVSPLPQSSM